MKRLLVVALLVLGTTSMTGCANGPIRNLFRGASCGSNCATNTNTSFYGSTCSECGSYVPGSDVYGSDIILPQTGEMPAPGPGGI